MLYPNVFTRLIPLFLLLAAVLGTLVPASQAQQLLPGLRGEYYSNPDLSGAPAVTRTDAQLDFEWQAGSPDALIPAENFSARWTGFVTSPVSELLTFHIFADDAVRVRVGGAVIWDTLSGPPGITTQTAFLAAGVPTPIEVTFRETTGWAGVRLAWSGLSQDWQIIPSTAFSHSPASAPAEITERGLKAEYFPNATLTGTPVLTRTEQPIYHEWQDGSPAASLPVNDFSARWSGTITARYTENYTFIVQADDAVRLWIGGTKVLDTEGTIGGGTVDVPMTAGQAVPIRLEFFETGGWASILFAWSSASQPWELVPASALLTGAPSVSRTPLEPVEKSLRLVAAGSDAPVFTFDRLAGDQSGMLVQVSPDLTAWQTIAADDPAWNITIDASATPGYETVRVQRVPPAVSGPREFYRVILPPVVTAQ